MHALFAAEASVLLLDPSNDHYKTITKLVMHSPMNTKVWSFLVFLRSLYNSVTNVIWLLNYLADDIIL